MNILNEQQWKAVVAARSLDEVNAIVDAAIRERAIETVKNAQPVSAPSGDVTEQLLEALQEVVALSDRNHAAWDRARAVIAEARGKGKA